MKPSVLNNLGLGDHVDNVVGTALFARAAAIQVRRTEGPSARMQDLAALSLGTMAVLDTGVTRRAASGLAITLSSAQSALGAIAGGIVAASGVPPATGGLFLPEWEMLGVPLDWLVFSVLQADLAADRGPLRVQPSPPRLYLNDALETARRDDGQPIGRLGISAYRWMRLISVPPGPERATAARWILERGAEDVERAMQDSFHWQRLHVGLAPVEPELLLAGLILLGGEPNSPIEPDTRSASRPVVRAALATAACMLGQDDLALDLGGPETEVNGQAGHRWHRWLDNASEGPLTW